MNPLIRWLTLFIVQYRRIFLTKRFIFSSVLLRRRQILRFSLMIAFLTAIAIIIMIIRTTSCHRPFIAVDVSRSLTMF